ncbi:hypothetical protein [Capnocytophaga cynodegmi]|uniref:Uncharacterized protein n=1 Tax=Capnocytophaga cynodegmi TaxID=28189 RepID=A0A0B7HAF3_9FLAO|nr:hypothetical protein [Capnocytophaga cynodegmi]CEN34942.1 hypothetical protein CCYN2B_240028 [Capnocytophaga cynodegmi]
MKFFNKKQNQTDTLLQERAIVEAIHREFDEAGEKLLQEALAIINKGTDDVHKAMRLKKLGFTNAEIVTKTEPQQKLIEISEKDAELVQYYRQTYLFLKFLKEEQLDAICKKYNLIYAPVANYIGDVPEKNLREIEQAQPLKKEDEIMPGTFWNSEVGFSMFGFIGTGLKLLKLNEPLKEIELETEETIKVKQQNPRIFKDKRGLFIAAPQSHFNLEGLKSEGLGFFKEVKDPIVFRYVRGGIQVLSKWGLEAYDEALINPINN